MMNVSVQIFLVILLVGLLLFMLSVLFTDNNSSNELSQTAFECGFEPFFMPRVPFSIHFFTVTIVFLIFDLEVVILVPVLFKLTGFWSMTVLTLMIWLLLGGLLIEWFDSSVSWQF